MAERQLMRLLLVDDDGVNRYTVSKALQRLGYMVAEVGGGAAALDRIASGDFDLILSEIDLQDTERNCIVASHQESLARCHCHSYGRIRER